MGIFKKKVEFFDCIDGDYTSSWVEHKKKFFTIGEKIWILSIILFITWVIIGLKFEIPIHTISILGSIGMIIFVFLGNLIRLLNDL